MNIDLTDIKKPEVRKKRVRTSKSTILSVSMEEDTLTLLNNFCETNHLKRSAFVAKLIGTYLKEIGK